MKRQNRQFTKFISLLKFPGLQYIFPISWKPVQLEGHTDWLHFGTTGYRSHAICIDLINPGQKNQKCA